MKNHARLRLEQLEPRLAPAGFTPSAVEQLFLERLNDARANPAAYGASIGLNLSGVAASMPLAFDPLLVQAARQHSLDMAARGFFAHTNPDGVSPSGRLNSAGYSWNAWGESIAAGFPDPQEALDALVIDSGVPDLGHRRHLLAMDATFRSHREIGVGFAPGGPFGGYFSIDTGRTADTRPYLTGVVFSDANGSGRYDIGEGRGARIEAYSGGNLVGAVDTFDSGGYSLRLSQGTYTVRVVSGGVVSERTVTLGSDNVRLSISDSSARPTAAIPTGVTPTAGTPTGGDPSNPAAPKPGEGIVRPGAHVIGSGVGAGSQVRIYDAARNEIGSLSPFGGFAGGTRVALGDLNGDGFLEVITAAGAGAPGGHVIIYNGRDLSQMASFFSYPGFLGGMNVAAGDVTGDGLADVITGAGPGAPGGHLKVFDGPTLREAASLFSYPGFVGGINVAVGDVNGDGTGDVITGAGPGAAGGHLKVFSGGGFSELLSIFAYGGYAEGVTVGAGDLNGDGFAEVVTGAAGVSPHVKVFDGATLQERGSFIAYPGAPFGVRVAVAGGRIVTAPAGPVPHVMLFSGPSLSPLDSFFVNVPAGQGGVFLAGS